MTFSIAAVIGLLSAIGSKFITMARLQIIHRSVAEAENDLNRVKSELKAVENYKVAANHELKSEENKQKTLKRQIDKYDKDLEKLKK